MSNMVFNTRPLQSRWGNLVDVKHMINRIHTVHNMMGKTWRQTRFLDHSRLSQTREVFVRHSADPLVGVVKVDQKELGMSLQFLFMLFSLGLKTWKICFDCYELIPKNKTYGQQYIQAFWNCLLSTRVLRETMLHTFSAIIWRKTSNTLSPTQIMHCIMPAKITKGIWGN